MGDTDVKLYYDIVWYIIEYKWQYESSNFEHWLY